MLKLVLNLIFLMLLNFKSISAVYENNPFFKNFSVQHKLKDQYVNIPLQVIINPSQQQVLTNGQLSNNVAWIQIPASNFNSSTNNDYVPFKPVVATQKPTNPPNNNNNIYPSDNNNNLNDALNKYCLKPRGQFASSSCNKFVNCWDGNAIEQSCPDDLLYNPSKGYCDYPLNVNCNGNAPSSVPSSSSSSSGESASTIATPTVPVVSTAIGQIVSTLPTLPEDNSELKKYCLKPRGQFRSSSCNKFVNCWEGNVVEQACPEGLLFSDKGYCDFAANVNCNGGQAPSEVPDPECVQSTGTFRDKTNCQLYYTCLAGKVAAKYTCPEGFSFNDQLGVCDYSNRVDCTITNNNYVDPDQFFNQYEHNKKKDESSLRSKDCPSEYGMFRDEKDCQKYYQCVGYKIAANYTCPEGFKFNNRIGVCDYENRVQCDESPLLPYNFVPQIPADFMDKISGCTPGQVFRMNANCSLACICRQGMAEFIQCPVGLSYDSPTDKCIPPHLARC